MWIYLMIISKGAPPKIIDARPSFFCNGDLTTKFFPEFNNLTCSSNGFDITTCYVVLPVPDILQSTRVKSN